MNSRITLIAVGVLLLTAACGKSQALTGDSTLPVMDVSNLTMTQVQADGISAPLRLQAKPGNLMILYFGYTTCPDICPTTLADFHTAIQSLGRKSSDVSVAFATVDRNRDTAPVLTNYLSHFGFNTGGANANSYAIRPQSDAELTAAENVVHASSAVTRNADGSIAVAHTAWSYVVDDKGQVIDEWPFGMTPKNMESDLHILLGRKNV